LWALVAASLPPRSGELDLPGLRAQARIRFDDIGVPTIEAGSREDAFLALGYVTAGERLFQMDFLRRKVGGRLAEVFGEPALDNDREQRVLGLGRVAEAVLARLPEAERAVLSAYAAGVNAAIDGSTVLPFEFLLAGYRPEPWTPADSLRAILGMVQLLTYTEGSERMLSVMQAALPPEVVAFLTPDTDRYTEPLLGGVRSHRPPTGIPAQALAALRVAPPRNGSAGLVRADPVPIGSNSWALAGRRTHDGRALLANDMHLPLAVPVIWYRAALRYAGHRLTGLTLPGIPGVVAGSNGQIAWGFTNINADVLDLVHLDLDPEDPNRYRTPAGWQSFSTASERITVKGGAEVVLEVKRSLWGPVLERPLLGAPVALRWTALEPEGTNLALLDMDRAMNLEDAARVMNRAGGPPQNALLADGGGRIGWTYTGRFPRRRGLDGATAIAWADGSRGWDGLIPEGALPRVFDPRQGLLVTANDRMLGADYPYPIGHDYAHGYRGHHIRTRLSGLWAAAEPDMLALQLDTRAAFYDFYRDLALGVLREIDASRDWPDASAVRRALERWDGRAGARSLGFALLLEFRRRLTNEVFAPFLGACRALDPDFSYTWHKLDVPLRKLLAARLPETLPDPVRYPDWQGFLLEVLKESAASLREGHPEVPLDRLSWGEVSRSQIIHPFSAGMPWLAAFLDMPREPLPGCPQCVRVVYERRVLHGASERMVLSPGHEADAILHLPGGQSGHPLSPHYRDQYRDWLEGRALPLAGKPVEGVLILKPAAGG
jgi:penicillin G amidase